MEKKDKIQILENAISRLMNSGILLDDSVVHYIDSTFAHPCAEDFRQILSDAGNCETETLYELIFFPDLRMQEQLEPVLADHAFDDLEVEAVISAIQQKKIHSRIRFPNSRRELSVQAPDTAVRRFIERLSITTSVDARIINTLKETVNEKSDMYGIRVMLRNCRVLFSDPFTHILCRCIEIMYPASQYFRQAFSFLLDFLETADASKTIYAGLMHKKQILGHMILQAEKNERILEKTSIEALMLTGVRIPPVHIGEARKKIALIDHICLSIYGTTDLTGY